MVRNPAGGAGTIHAEKDLKPCSESLLRTTISDAEFTMKRPRWIPLVASLMLSAAAFSCGHDSILQRTPPPNPNGNWHGYLDCGGLTGDFGFTIAVDSAGSVTGGGGEICHLSVATFTVTGSFVNPDLSLTRTYPGGLSYHLSGTLQGDTIFVSAGGPPKLARISQ
jgi:hypothetical protein